MSGIKSIPTCYERVRDRDVARCNRALRLRKKLERKMRERKKRELAEVTDEAVARAVAARS